MTQSLSDTNIIGISLSDTNIIGISLNHIDITSTDSNSYYGVGKLYM